jgi:nucleoside-diphosphate-sugar epimerase
MMAKVLVAGGAGFIGSHLCKRLIEDGYSVICLDSLITGDKKNLISLLENPRFTFMQQDIADTFDSSLNSQLTNLNYIYHLASPASPNEKSDRSFINKPIETLRANSFGTYNLLNLAKETNAQFLLASTSEVYGNPEISPQPETYFGNVNPNGPRSCYDEGKRFAEAMTFAYVRKYDMNCRIVRIFNTYGPFMQKDDGRVVSAFINQALEGVPITVFGDGTHTRSFCYVDDMVEGLIKAMMTGKTSREVINLGNPDERNILEVAQIVKKMVFTYSEIVYEVLPQDDPKKRKPDISKARGLLSWEPKIEFEEGLKRTIEYFRKT